MEHPQDFGLKVNIDSLGLATRDHQDEDEDGKKELPYDQFRALLA
jgi:hypothetical protein